MEQQNTDNMSGYEATVPVMIANIQRLRAVNAKLLAALEELVGWLGKRPAGIHPEAMIEYTRARDAIKEAKK